MSVLLGIAAACSRSGAPVPSASGVSGSALDHLSGPATLAAGMSLHGHGAEIASSYKAMEGRLPEKIPPCALEVLGRMEEAAAAVDLEGEHGRFVVRGAGLRGPAEACLRSFFPDVKIEDVGKLTHYRRGQDDLPLLWIGDAIVIGGPPAEAAGLDGNPTPLAADERMRPLLGKIDTSQAFWFVADVARLDKKGTLPLPAEAVWGTVDDQAFHATIAFGSKDDATRCAALVQELAGKMPVQVLSIVEQMTVAVDGAKTVVTVPYRKLMTVAGVDEKTVPASVAPIFAVGVLASVAIPAFLTNARKAKATEATMNVKRIYEGAFAEYNLSHRLPAKTGVTPPLGTCCSGARQKCAPEASLWTSAAWKALRFDMEDPHRYSYAFTSDKTTFTATAYGDLNCDGVYSTFEMTGTIAADGTITGGKMLKIDHELE